MESLNINCETGEETRVPYTANEIKEAEALGVSAQAKLKAETEAREAANAKLAALGLTADDLKALGL